MTVTCPYCAAMLPDSSSGTFNVARKCPGCHKEFEFYEIERPYESLVPQLVEGRTINDVGQPHPASTLPAHGTAPTALPPPIPPPTAPPPRPAVFPSVPGSIQSGVSQQATTQGTAPAALPLAEPLDARPLTERTCANHPNNRAAALCDQCHRAICNLCATPTEGRLMCPQCFEVLRARGALDSTRRAYNTPALALGLALATLFAGWMYCLGFLLGPLAIYFGVRALSEIDQRPELPGRRKAMAAIIVAGIGMAVSIGVLLLFAIGVVAGAGAGAGSR